MKYPKDKYILNINDLSKLKKYIFTEQGLALKS